jgi:glyoxylate reductase
VARPRVHEAAGVPAEIERELRESFELMPGIAGAQGVVVTPATTVDAAFLDAAGAELQIVANFAVGIDNLDRDAARERGIVLTNTPGVLTNATAEHALGLMLALLRRIAEGDRSLRRRDDWEWGPDYMVGDGLEGRKVLVVGAGRIGRRVAELVEALGARVSYAGRDDDLRALLAEADVVTLHCPLTPETRHLVDDSALAAMRPTAILVNTARGPVVDEAALMRALETGVIAGAALDVYEREPSVSERLLELENVVLTPHIASATSETRAAMTRVLVNNVLAYSRGESLPNKV